MADVRWIGGAAAVAQVDDFTPSDPAQNDVLTLTVTGENGDTKAITFTVGATHTVAAAIAGIVAAWNASTHYLCTPITASDNASTTVKLTADTAGVPFYVASTISAGTFTRAATTANSGPNDYNTALNWDGGVVPGYAGSQIVYIEGATILYGLNQTAGTDGADSINIYDSQISANPSDGRKPAYLYYDVGTVLNINDYKGPGSPSYASPVYVRISTASAVVTVYNSGTNSDTTLPSVNLIIDSLTSTLYIYGGSVGLSYSSGDADSGVDKAYLYGSGSLYVGENAAIDHVYMNSSGTLQFVSVTAVSDLVVNSGTSFVDTGTVAACTVNGGSVVSYAPFTVLNLNGGTVTQYDSLSVARTIGTLTQTGGTFYSRATGTVTAATILGGICDASAEIPRTWTAVKLDPPGTFKFNSASQTLSAHVEPNTSTKIVTYSAS